MVLEVKLALINVPTREKSQLSWLKSAPRIYLFNEFHSEWLTEHFGYFVDFTFGINGFNVSIQPITERELFLIALKLMGVN